MGFFDRLGRLVRANLNNLISQAEDPEKILEQTVNDMQEDLIQLRQSVAQAIATQKRTERQCSQAESNAEEWYKRAQLALQKGEEGLAREALSRRQSYLETSQALKAQIEQQRLIVDSLRKNMMELERKIADAKTKKDMYIARARSAQASEKLNNMISRVGSSGAMSAFERMEAKVMELEARSEAIAELNAGDDVERAFAALESGSNVDAELEAMKAQLRGQTPPESLPAASSEVEAELNQLRSKLDQT
jgi:phage shock protein A